MKGRWRWIACLLLLGLASPASGQKREAVALQAEAMDLYRQRDYAGAIERLERAFQLTPRNFELLRHIGSCHAMNADRERAYQYYREYVERCPKCLYAPTVARIIQDYEKGQSLPLSGPELPPRPSPPSLPPPPRPAPAEEDAGLTAREVLLAQRLLANARTLRVRHPLGAVLDCLDAMKLLPRAHPLHARARALFTELTWLPAPWLAAPTRADTRTRGEQLDAACDRAEELRATKPGLAAIIAEMVMMNAADDDPALERARALIHALRTPEEAQLAEDRRLANRPRSGGLTLEAQRVRDGERFAALGRIQEREDPVKARELLERALELLPTGHPQRLRCQEILERLRAE